jgi:dipeptidase E
MGGHASRFEDLVLELAGPRVCFVPTASSDEDWTLVRFYESFGHRAEASHVSFAPWPRADLREHVLGQDAVYVAGGSTANLLAIWRVHGFDELLREAWESGVLLCGWSAGANCWFEASVTDSFGPELAGLDDGLGLLPGSFCPHYDEESRRAVYGMLIERGFPAGYAAETGVALRFEGSELVEVVSEQEGAHAYRVEADGETALESRVLA